MRSFALIRCLCSSQSTIVRRPLPPDDPTRRCPDITRARTLLEDWAPQVSLEQGLLLTIADFRARLGLVATKRASLELR